MSLVLLLVAVVPLAGMGAVTWGKVGDARATQRAAKGTNAIAREVVSLTDLNSALLDEMLWSAIAAVASDLQADASVTATILGTDPLTGLRRAQAHTDALVVEAGRTDIAESVRAARSEATDLGAALAAYRSVMDTLGAPLTAALRNLTATVSGDAEAALPAGARLLGYAIDARTAIADGVYGYFATVLDLRDVPAVELSRLIHARATWDANVATLWAEAPRGSAFRAAVARLQADPALGAFNDTIDDLIAASLAGGLPSRGSRLSLESIAPRVDSFIAVYTTASALSASTADVVDASSAMVLAAASDVQQRADDNIGRAFRLALLLTTVTFVMALLAARFIVRPLRHLRRAAEGLQQELHVPHSTVAGPVEVRAAATAIHDAGEHLDLVTRQVRALAVGSLDADVLDESAPGGLGAAVQTAVGTLRSALAQQDEFRRRLAHEASHDGLTQLPNRNASMAQLTRSLARTTRSGSQLAVLFIDVDHFKDVNDHHGHHAGDTVLSTVAHRLVNGVREGDFVGRLGGDEFVVVAEPVSDLDEAIALAQRLLDRLAAPVDLDDAEAPVHVGASIGIALSGEHDLTADELLRDADLAVYRAKALGRGRFEICDEDLRAELAESADLSLALRQAIECDELVVHYQPIIDTRTNQLRAFEALVRWRRPGHDGLIPPDHFIGFAERSNLIVDVDRWVMDAVAAQLAHWQRGGCFERTPIAVNVSSRHLAHEHLVDHILEPLRRHAVHPRSIIVEVTESALLDDLAGAAAKLQCLRDHGIRVSIDDFGTGYTSLAHLRSLPIDILKIDRSFTVNAAVDAHEASIVKLIIDTGHLLGATVTAEGVENAVEASALTDLGSDALQGFYYALPQTPDTLCDLIGGPR